MTMDQHTTDTVAAISALAPDAARINAEHAAAIDAERTAEAQVLEAAIAHAKPALRAVCGKVRVYERHYWVNSVQTETDTTDHEVPGLLLAGNGTAQEDHPRSNGGAYEGCGLWLLRDGTLAELTYAGHWSRWQGSASEWTADLARVTPREAMDSWELAECLGALKTALERVVNGKAPEKTKAARERAEKLAALAALVK
jgi:hypothetical protein